MVQTVISLKHLRFNDIGKKYLLNDIFYYLCFLKVLAAALHTVLHSITLMFCNMYIKEAPNIYLKNKGPPVDLYKYLLQSVTSV